MSAFQKKIIALSESIMQKGKPATAGSKILDGFVSPLDAAVVEKLQAAGADFVRVDMDEFGIEKFFTDTAETADGAVEAVASGKADFGLCNDLFGKARRQAAERGLCYIHPTYGTVSRYGLIPSVCSMDQIGVVFKSPEDGFGLLSAIAGKDERDGAMFPEASYAYEARHEGKLRVGIPVEIWRQTGCEPKLPGGRFEAVELELAHFDVYEQVLYILSCAEICNNTNRYDGVKFGYRAPDFFGVNDRYTKTRSVFGTEAKLSILMGGMVLSQENYAPLYEKAMKLRRLIKESLDFGSCELIALPAKNAAAPYARAALYALPVLAGLPCLSFKHDGCGVQLIAGVKKENTLYKAWEAAVL